MQSTEHLYTRYGRVVDLLPELVFVLDEEGKILDLNTSARTQMMDDRSPLVGTAVSSLVVAEEREVFRRFWINGQRNLTFETRFVKPDASEIDVSVKVKDLSSAGGVHRVLMAKDVTEEKRKELDLLRFSNVIHNTINPIQITDARGMMVYVNPAFERVSGYRRDELIGHNPNILNSGKHGKEFWADVWTYILSGKVWVGRVENRRKDGTPFFTELVISPIVDSKHQVVGFLGAHRDITEQKLLEQQLVHSQKMESIGTLAAGIAHEVGNPLTAISSLVQVIQRTSNDQFAKEKLELINSQVNRITRIIRELVDFSRPTTHTVRAIDANQVVRDALNIVQYGKKVRDITFDVHLAENLPQITIVADQYVQVLINILINAVDALEGKQGTIAIRSRADGQWVEVSIADSGTGIPMDDLEKIFEPFFTTKQVGKGTGLGLWVSYGIIKNFGGDIRVESSPGKGSAFKVMIPRKDNHG